MCLELVKSINCHNDIKYIYLIIIIIFFHLNLLKYLFLL